MRPSRAISKQGASVYASRDIFCNIPLDEWDQKLGHTFVQSAGPTVVELANHPMVDPTLQSRRAEASIGTFVSLVKQTTVLEQAQSTLSLTLYWRAEKKIPTNYAIMVHLVDPAQNDKIIAQGDSANPVYGFYPTSRWQKGEIVRDDYALTVPRNLALEKLNLVVGWYRTDPSGAAFHNLGTFRIAAPIARR